jgi:hypothetical protein
LPDVKYKFMIDTVCAIMKLSEVDRANMIKWFVYCLCSE